MEMWNSISEDIICAAMLSCGITNAPDASEDVMINCFKEDQPTAAGMAMLQLRCHEAVKGVRRMTTMRSKKWKWKKQKMMLRWWCDFQFIFIHFPYVHV